MTICFCRTMLILMMAIQITHKQKRDSLILSLHGSHWCLVNSQKSGYLGHGYRKTEHKVLFHTTNAKTSILQQPNWNLGWRNAPYLSRTWTTIPRSRIIMPWHNKTGRPKPGTSNSDTWHISGTKTSEHNSAPRSGHYGSRPGPHITVEYSADIRNRRPRARNRSLRQAYRIR